MRSGVALFIDILACDSPPLTLTVRIKRTEVDRLKVRLDRSLPRAVDGLRRIPLAARPAAVMF
jgi:hypothetical protein